MTLLVFAAGLVIGTAVGAVAMALAAAAARADDDMRELYRYGGTDDDE